MTCERYSSCLHPNLAFSRWPRACCYFFSIFLFVALVAIRLLTPFYFAFVIQALQDGKFEPTKWLVGYACLFTAIRILEELRFAAYVYFEQYFQKSLVVMLLRRFFYLPRKDIGQHASAETSIIVDRGLEGLRGVMYNLIFSIGPLFIEALVLLAVLAVNVSATLAVLALVLLACFALITYIFTNKISLLQAKWYQTASRNFKILAESIKSHGTVKSFEKPSWIVERYAIATDEFISEVLDSLSPGIIMGILQGILIGSIAFTVNFAIIVDHGGTKESIPLLVLVNGLIIQIIAPLVQFASAYRMFIQGISSAKQLVHLLTVKEASLKLKHSFRAMEAAVKVHKVKAPMLCGRSMVFKDIEIMKHSCTVITGRTGTGKSTLARLISGLLDYSGKLFVDQSHEQIYYLSQDVDVFDTTLEENVSLNRFHDPVLMQQCLTDAGFNAQEIQHMSNRTLGEGGNAISGGQKSRLGIARMLYHDANILVFDEPTASLDDKTADQIRMTILGLRSHATIIVVTHDKRFAESADQVYEIGEIGETEA